jgi:hypothetical protein
MKTVYTASLANSTSEPETCYAMDLISYTDDESTKVNNTNVIQPINQVYFEQPFP